MDQAGSALVAMTAPMVLLSIPMARPKSDLTKFILSLPETLTTAEVIEKAKVAGMETTESNVQRVRADQKKRSATPPAVGKKPVGAVRPSGAKKTALKKPSKPAEKKAASPKAAPTKTEFVLGQPATTSAKDVAAKATAAGIELTPKHVHTIRSKSKAAKAVAKKPAVARKAATKNVTKPKAAAKAPTAGPTVDGDVVSFRKLVLGLGILRARQLLEDLERGLAALIRG